jgi:8-oxo-dGTP diphosphatase
MSEQQNAKQRPLVGVSVLIKNGDRILLEKRDRDPGMGAWKAPGGHLEFGEDLEQTATREVEEEVGVNISNLKFRTITNDIFEDGSKHYITIWMEATYESGEPQVKAPYEESEIGWFTWGSLPQPLYLPIRHLLEGKTYPSQTTESKIGSAIETTAVLPGAGAEALRPDPSNPDVKHVSDLRPDVSESVNG